MDRIRRTVLAALATLAAGRAWGGSREIAMEMKPGMREDMPGSMHESQIQGLREEIASGEVISFEYSGRGTDRSAPRRQGFPPHPGSDFMVSAKRLPSGSLAVESSGGNYAARDNSAFRLKYETEDRGFMAELAELVRRHRIGRGNGRVVHVNGLPAGLGDTISVRYAGGERIYKSSNQTMTIAPEAADEIYDAFRRLAERSGRGFTTAQSTETIYDDPTPDFLQGAWRGKHFGRECRAVFSGRRIVITYDGTVADDTGYVIANGAVVPDRLRAKPVGDREQDRYETFGGDIISFSKANDFTIVAHFYRNRSSSSCRLLRER